MTTVVKISGKPIAEPESAAVLWADLAAHARDAVIVHGGGKQVDALFARLGITIERRDGIRLTSEADMPLVAGVLAGEVNQTLVGLLCAAGARAVGISLASAGVVGAEVDPRIGGRVGRITGGDGSTPRALLASGVVPVVASIGRDAEGKLLNINADDAAAGVAAAINAERVLLLTDVEGVIDASGRTIGQLDEAGVEAAIGDGVITGGMIAKVRSALGVAQRVPGGVVIASWKDAARALAGQPGVGTTIRATMRQGSLT